MQPFHLVAMGFGVVVVAKIFGAGLKKWVGLSF